MNGKTRTIRVVIAPPGRAFSEQHPEPEGIARPGAEFQTPPIDIYEVEDGLVLEADLPGASEGSVTVQLVDNLLSLHAQVANDCPAEAKLVHEEYRVGDFARSFILSDEVDRDRITAEISNGVLRLKLPRAEQTRTRRIEVKSS